MKKMFARQRAKDLAEHAKNMLSKDREIEDLRKKCQELADQLSNADFLGPEVTFLPHKKMGELGDNCIPNFHLGRYIVGYAVGSWVLW